MVHWGVLWEVQVNIEIGTQGVGLSGCVVVTVELVSIEIQLPGEQWQWQQ
jgi:hypothetical protein